MQRVSQHYDVVIVGAGINGSAVALEMGLRGFKTLIIDQHDIAAGTSSASSKLVHGGLRYLQHASFDLVFESLREQKLLLRNAPHLVKPLRFCFPVFKKIGVSKVSLFLGLFCYSLLSLFNKTFSFLPSTKLFENFSFLNTLYLNKNLIKGAFFFDDAVMDDAEICVQLIEMASKHDVNVITYINDLTLISEKKHEKTLSFRSTLDDIHYKITGRLVISCTGPWTDSFFNKLSYPSTLILPSKGIHFLTSSIKIKDAFACQTTDNRLIFALPWHKQTLIGTTETLVKNNLDDQKVLKSEIDYLCSEIKNFFQIDQIKITASFWGIRPLVNKNASSLHNTSRKEKIFFQQDILTVCGGKYTTFRNIAEKTAKKALKILQPTLGFISLTKTLTYDRVITKNKADFFSRSIYLKYLNEAQKKQLIFRYGTNMDRVFFLIRQYEDALITLGDSNYFRIDVYYSLHFTFAKRLSDFFRRRSTLFFHENNGLEYLHVVAIIFKDFFNWNDKRLKEEIKSYHNLISNMLYDTYNESKK